MSNVREGASWFRRVSLFLTLFFVAQSLSLGCSRPVQTARMSVLEPYSERELEAQQRAKNRRCSSRWTYMPLILGLGQYCAGKDGEAAALALVGAADAGTAIYASSRVDGSHPAVVIPALAFQDAYLIGIADTIIDGRLAEAKLYTPTDSLLDLSLAPFNWEVMKRPKVWAGIAVMLAAGVGLTAALDGGFPSGSRDQVNVFGRDFSPEVGYPTGMAAFGGLFTHVAIAEEMIFRGAIQSDFARTVGQTQGWLGASAIFGVIHAPNALALEPEDRSSYLLYGVPFITVLGSYMGYVYKESDYSLAPPTAIHFWYNTLLSATFFALDPNSSPLAANFRFRF